MKYTPETVQTIIKAIGDGLTIEDACEVAGISEQTFYRWKTEPDKHDLCDSLKKAEIAGEQMRLASITRQGEKDWRAHAWYLERTKQAKYALRNKVEHSGSLQVITSIPKPDEEGNDNNNSVPADSKTNGVSQRPGQV